MPNYSDPWPHGPGFTADQLKLQVKKADNRNGRIMDIYAKTYEGEDGELKKITISEHAIFDFPDNGIELIIVGSDEIPTGKSLELAGTAFIENEKKIVAVYR
ncbi:hypothetical protein AAG602_02865 [Citromicrobium bathyomarinum]